METNAAAAESLPVVDSNGEDATKQKSFSFKLTFSWEKNYPSNFGCKGYCHDHDGRVVDGRCALLLFVSNHMSASMITFH